MDANGVSGNLVCFGFGTVAKQADGKVHLTADARDEHGVVRPGSVLDLSPEE